MPIQNSVDYSEVVPADLRHRWEAPVGRPTLGGFHHAHYETLGYLIGEHHLTPDQASAEINQLTWVEVSDLKQLYSYGLRGNHIRDVINHVVSNYPDFDFFGEITSALDDLIRLQGWSVEDAVDEVKLMQRSHLSQFTVD